MTPEAASEMQIERYRQMTGEERLLIGLRLHELSCEVTREGIRAQFPGITEEEVERKLGERIRLSYPLNIQQKFNELLAGSIKPKTT